MDTTRFSQDINVFNSSFNMESFLKSISSHLKLIPDHRPKNLEAQIRPKCQVLYFPLLIPNVDKSCAFAENDKAAYFLQTEDKSHSELKGNNRTVGEIIDMEKSSANSDNENLNSDSTSLPSPSKQLKKDGHVLHIVWPHRWEHDKDPKSFFDALLQLQGEGHDFCVSVIGETFSEVPEVFSTCKPLLTGRIVAWGYQSREDYLKVLDAADVVVSTAQHEFFGVSMLEAVSHGCYPLCPKRLVYPEIYPEECLYATQTQLVKKLRRFCQRPALSKQHSHQELIKKFLWENLQVNYRQLLLN
ncbi:glycosyltransferase-like domain-containing protein 1 isoform X2 [Physella acuta]|uniref:glycosyltransferase-like domain-containing protein 1 isoform X2 n=1 Tax=Physella acuta TaxID=109671 RepID=UPI0027DE7D0F|nr:glycosyltransferase-like domain-containing protein 1 isoform X2 [Physella acuta]